MNEKKRETERPGRRVWKWVGWTSLLALIVGVFWPVLSYDFVRWDDDLNVTGNGMLVRPWSWDLFFGFFDPQAALRFKPLHWFVFRLVADVNGFDPRGWHAVGLGCHLGTTLMLFVVFRMVLRRVCSDLPSGKAEAVAWLGAAFWAVHPLRVETVAWVTASTYPMTGLLLVSSFGAYLRAYDSGVSRRWLVLAWLFAVAAYATYPVSVTYVGWLVAVDAGLLKVAPTRPWSFADRATRRWWVKHSAFAAPAMIAVGFTLWTRLLSPGRWGTAPNLNEVGWDERLLAGWASLTVFPTKIVWPADLTPNHPEILGTLWLDGRFLFFGALTTAVALGLWLVRKRRPGWGWFGVGYAFLALPCLGLTENPTWPVDRYGYLLDMVWIGAGAIMAAAWIRRPAWKSALGAVVVTGLVAAIVCTRGLLPIWRDSSALFAHMETSPLVLENDAQLAHVYLMWGKDLHAKGRDEEARDKLHKANETYLAAMHRALAAGNYPEAVKLAGLMEANLGLPITVRRERGLWLLRLGRGREAVEDLRRVVKEAPEDQRARELLSAAGG